MSVVSPVASPVVLNFGTGVMRTQRSTPATDAVQNLRLTSAAKTTVSAATSASNTLASARTSLAAIPDSFRQAYANLTRRLQSVRAIQWIEIPGSDQDATFSALAATNRVNAQGSTVQSSTSPLGLNLDPSNVIAKLTSTQALGLDTEQSARASILDGTTALGLDLTTPESPSRLTSSTTIGLDVTSPGSHSVLTSTDELNTGDQDGVPIDVDPNAVFDDEDVNLRPRFDLDAQISFGSFTVNGTQIDVLSGDSINSVLARINSTVTGVTASFANDRVTFETNANSEDDIVLADDTSGFLAALKLADATTTKGNIADDQQVLAKTSQFASVTSGSFTINGVAIDVDRDTDTLQSILSKITNTGAEVTASYDPETDKISIVTNDSSEFALLAGDDSTGLLDALGLSNGENVPGHIRDDRKVLTDLTPFASVVSGSFNLNGVNIQVQSDIESLDTLLNRINNANAGVTATYDSESGKIRLTSATNNESDIEVTDDTSGFLEAAGLSTANTVRGNLPDDQETFATSAKFSAVTSGSFNVNGSTISIDRDTDTLQSILAKINDAGAGVTATYDSATDRIQLTAEGEGDIVVDADDTGFLAAAGLSDAVTEHESARDDERVLHSTSQFAAVTTGSFQLNGRTISVDPATDSLVTLVARMNSANAGVTVTYDESSDRVVFTPEVEGETVTLDNDSSGFLDAAHLPTGVSGAQINPDALFNGTGEDSPGFEDGLSVSAGSFEINGTTIEVAEDDSLSSVLAKIDASDAGVSAAFNASTQKVTLTAKATGNTAIDVGNDSSGFLAAVKLDASATFTAGQEERTTETTWTRVETDTGRRSLNDPNRAATELAAVFAQLNTALEQVRQAGNSAPQFRTDTERVLRAAVDSVPNAAARGLTLSTSTNSLRVNVDVRQLAAALTSDPKAVQQLFRGSDNLPDGLESLLNNYAEHDTDSTGSGIPDRASVAASAVGDARQFVVGEQTLAEQARAEGDRQLRLLQSAAAPAPAVDKVRKAYGLAA